MDDREQFWVTDEKVTVFESHFYVNVTDYILEKCFSSEAENNEGPFSKNSDTGNINIIHIKRMFQSSLPLNLTIASGRGPCHCSQNGQFHFPVISE